MRLTSIACLLVLVIATGLSGCAANRYCAREQPYEDARSVPPIQGTDGLKIPESSTAMRVPDGTAHDAPFGVKVEDPKHPGKTRYQCLDQPPTLPAGTATDKPLS